jgi:3-isopropylmalate/(R)-2-methylmalate dehydratase small subunit
MKAVRVHTGRAAPLPRSDVDTDQIIPSDWLKRVERTGFGRGLFSEWRDEPSFVLNDERYTGATVLVAGANFGVGSSREHAVWALLDYGFDVVISPRFGDIFRNNSTKNGLVPVVLDEAVVVQLQDALDEDPDLEIVVDVERRVVEVASLGIVEPFPMDDAVQHRFINGLDDIGITMAHEAEIDEYEAHRREWLPSVT